jgi:hypothetical protein
MGTFGGVRFADCAATGPAAAVRSPSNTSARVLNVIVVLLNTPERLARDHDWRRRIHAISLLGM